MFFINWQLPLTVLLWVVLIYFVITATFRIYEDYSNFKHNRAYKKRLQKENI